MKTTRGKKTVLKVILHVERTQWSGRSQVLDNLAAMIEAEDAKSQGDEDWVTVEKPVEGIGFKYGRP